MVTAGKRGGHDLEGLETSSNKYHRYLFLQAQNGARNAEAVARFLRTETTTSLRWGIVRLAMTICSDADCLVLIAGFEDALAMRAACCLRRVKRTTLVDQYVRSLDLGQNRALVCSLMRFGSPQLVGRHFHVEKEGLFL
jgi:hypothetical protein